MKVLFAAVVLLGFSVAFDSPVVSSAQAAAKKCDHQACVQRCVANRGRFCNENCKSCQ